MVEAYEAFTKGTMEVFAGAARRSRGRSTTRACPRARPGLRPRPHLLGFALNARGAVPGPPRALRARGGELRRGIALAPESSEGTPGWPDAGRHGARGRGLRGPPAGAGGGPRGRLVHLALGRAHFVGKGHFREGRGVRARLELDPKLGWAALQLAQCCAYLGEFERGEAAARAAIASQEENVGARGGMRLLGAYVRLGHLHELQGRRRRRDSEYYRELVSLRRPTMRSRTGWRSSAPAPGEHLPRQGSAEDARTAFAEAAKVFEERLEAGPTTISPAITWLRLRAVMGDADRALESLEQAAGDAALTAARGRLDPDFEGLRSDARFQAVLARR